MRLTARPAALAVLAAGLSLAACGGSAPPSSTRSATAAGSTAAPAGADGSTSAPVAPGADAAPTGPSAFTQPGPYPVGTLELEAPNGPITVWYPAEPGSEAGHDKATYDLSVKNPNKAEEVKLRDPNEIIAEIAALDDESAEILAGIGRML